MPVKTIQKPVFVKTLSDSEWATASLKERALHVAKSQAGQREWAGQPNWGPMVKVYLKAAGWISPAPWCGAFLYWCLVTAGANKKHLPSNPASTWQWVMWAKRNSRNLKNPKRGDAFVWFRPGAGGHCGLVAEVVGDKVRTFEGNTNDAGSREGVEVAERHRSKASILGASNGMFIALESLD